MTPAILLARPYRCLRDTVALRPAEPGGGLPARMPVPRWPLPHDPWECSVWQCTSPIGPFILPIPATPSPSAQASPGERSMPWRSPPVPGTYLSSAVEVAGGPRLAMDGIHLHACHPTGPSYPGHRPRPPGWPGGRAFPARGHGPAPPGPDRSPRANEAGNVYDRGLRRPRREQAGVPPEPAQILSSSRPYPETGPGHAVLLPAMRGVLYPHGLCI